MNRPPQNGARSAVERIRNYAGLEPDYKPITETLKQSALEQMAKPGVIYPWRTEIETELGRHTNCVDGIAALLENYRLEHWQEPYRNGNDTRPQIQPEELPRLCSSARSPAS
jgi:hypothetical protein